MAAGTAAAAALSGCSALRDDSDERPRAEPDVDEAEALSDPHERFDTVVDMRAAGADDTGEERVDDLLRQRAGDDTLLRFPEGEYRIGRVWFEGLENFGILGEDATFVLDERGRNVFLSFKDVADLHLEGLAVDSTAENTASWLDVQCSGGSNVVRDYAVEGFGDVSERTNGLTVQAAGEETSLTIDRANLPDGAENGAATFVFGRDFVDTDLTPGTLTFRDCVMKGWGKEGLYASEHSGLLRVIGGEYANNAIVQVRVGGGNAPARALVRDVTIRIDEVPAYMPEKNRVLRGIWLKEGDLATVENCEVTIENVNRGSVQGGIVVNNHFGRAIIRNTRVQTAFDSPALFLQRPVGTFDQEDMPALHRMPDEWWIRVENVVVDASTASDAVFMAGRDGCTFDGVEVDQSGSGDGVHVQDADGCVVSGGSIAAGRFPVLFDRFRRKDASRLYLNDVTSIESAQSDDEGQFLTASLDNRYSLGTNMVGGNVPALAVTRAEENGIYGREVGRELIRLPSGTG